MTPFFAPQNFKNGRLIARKYRIIDLVFVIIVFLIFFPLILVVLTNDGVSKFLLIPLVIPPIVSFFLVQPFHVYHNLLVYLELVFLYFTRTKVYKWGGIVKYEEKNGEE